MAEYIEPGPICDTAGIREAVCIHTRKIFDSCRDKDISSLINFCLYMKPQKKFCTTQCTSCRRNPLREK